MAMDNIYQQILLFLESLTYWQSVLILIAFSVAFKRYSQSFVLMVLLGTFFIKLGVAHLLNVFYPLYDVVDGNKIWIYANLDMHFILADTARVIQHSFLSFVVVLFLYKDRRCFLPAIANTVIVVFYTASIIAILFFDSYNIQRLAVNYELFTGLLVVLSLLDYGGWVYDRLYSNSIFTSNKYISRLYSTIVFRVGKEDAEKESAII